MPFHNLDLKSRQVTPTSERLETEQAALRDRWETLADGKESRRALHVGAWTTGWCLTNGEHGASLREGIEFRLSICVWKDYEGPRAGGVHGWAGCESWACTLKDAWATGRAAGEKSSHSQRREAAFPEPLSLPAHSQQAGSEQPHLTPTPAWAKHPRELWVLPFGFALWFYHLEVRVCDMYAHLFLTSRLGYQHRISCMTHSLPFSGIVQERLELFLLKCLLEGTG